MSKNKNLTEARTGVSRRKFIVGAGAAGMAASWPLILTPGKAKAADQVVLISWGGAYRESVEANYVKPFTQETGIPVLISDTPDMAKVKAQVTTKNVEWDVFDGVGSMAMSGQKEGYWEPLDKSVIDLSHLRTGVYADTAAFYTAAGGIAWDPKRYPDGKHPVDFKQYWDTKKFPGRRSFRTRVSETLEAALIADGVAPRSLYPLDVDRAFKSLDRIKPNVAKWIEQTPQTITLLQQNEVDFTYTYASRVKAAAAGGQPIQFSFEQTINIPEYVQVLKGAPHKAAAMKFVAFMLRPDRLAAFCDQLGLAPNSDKAMALLSPEAKKWQPNMANPNNVVMDDAWWAANYAPLEKRFKEWLLA
jgi:putative spermidine/putrescine transport system substrate-binding protein